MALSLYHSSAYLGPTLAFLVATPIINPAAVILAFVLLGPQLTAIYIITGFMLPIIIGLLGNKFGKDELISPVAAAIANVAAGSARINSAAVKISWSKKIVGGLDWGVRSLGLQVSRYVLVGLVLAALLLAIIPVSYIQDYLSRPDMISLRYCCAGSHYVCVCSGHSLYCRSDCCWCSSRCSHNLPINRTATNLPELFSIFKLIGKRTIVIYTGTVILCSFVVGYITNYLLMPGFTPVFDLRHPRIVLH